MKVCPNNALHPALTEAGLEGLWTPIVVPRIGYCESSCVLCSEVCPTGAIWEITAKEKGWEARGSNDAKAVRLGTAFYDRGRCLPWAMATPCIVCEEWCPTSPKAIYLQPAEVADAEGHLQQVKQPFIDPQRCVGCGACEICLPGSGSSGSLRDQRRREPVANQPDTAESRQGDAKVMNIRRVEARGLLVVMLVMALLLSAGCKRQSGSAQSVFPASNEVAGWVTTGDIRTFEAVDLWKYIDGDAERYLKAGPRNRRCLPDRAASGRRLSDYRAAGPARRAVGELWAWQ